MSKPIVNTENFEILMQAIMDNYDSFVMDAWGIKSDISPCGSVGCIAGTADWLANISGMAPAKGCEFLFDKKGHIRKQVVNHGYEGEFAFDNAMKWLSIDYYQANSLFYAGNWPNEYSMKFYRVEELSKSAAKVAVSRIKYFLETGN